MNSTHEILIDVGMADQSGRRVVIARTPAGFEHRDRLNTDSETARKRFVSTLASRLGIEPQKLDHVHDEIIVEADAADNRAEAALPGDTDGGGKHKSQATQLVEMAADDDLFHDPDQIGYVSFDVNDCRQTWRLKSKQYHMTLQGRFFKQTGKAASSQAINDAIGALACRAIFQGKQRPVAVRVAEQEGTIFVNLANDNWEAVAIKPDGWQIVADPPIRFRRPRAMVALLHPVKGGSIDDLRRFINLDDENGPDQWPLLATWLVAALRPTGPFPILCLNGEQGSAKSTVAKMLRMLIDPSTCLLRADPRNPQDVVITASNSWVICLDNLSGIRLGKISQRAAEAIKIRVEHLVAAAITGAALDSETSRWVARLDSVMANKLALVGLVAQRRPTYLGDFLDGYFAKRADVKFSTQIHWRHTQRNLVEFFGREKPLGDITPGDADDWRLYLINSQRLSDSTVNKRCGNAKQFLKDGVRHNLIERNPFSELKSSVVTNPSRFYFISRDESQEVLDACPDAQWRLLFALSRFGGLRCPSEHLLLSWCDIDWERNRISIRSPKTEHHPGGGLRVAPIFPELRPYLETVFEQADPGTEYVITRYRQKNSNLRTQLGKIIRRAGLKPWPKLFQNLRSTRQTELEEVFPSHVVCGWMGNSQAVASKHYLQITDDHFKKAAKDATGALHNPVQHSAAGRRTVPQTRLEGVADNAQKAAVNSGLLLAAAQCENALVGDDGLEPPTSTV